MVVVVFVFVLVDGERYLHLRAPAGMETDQLSRNWDAELSRTGQEPSEPVLPFGVIGAQLSVEVEQTIITPAQQGGGGG